MDLSADMFLSMYKISLSFNNKYEKKLGKCKFDICSYSPCMWGIWATQNKLMKHNNLLKNMFFVVKYSNNYQKHIKTLLYLKIKHKAKTCVIQKGENI